MAAQCPRRSAATVTTLTAATCGVLTGFMSFRPADLGHAAKLPGFANQRQPGRQASGMCSISTSSPKILTPTASNR